ncbi:MAG: AarF/ABC1/UbiB kinase family protein [Verrucomicrobiota bacterium]
MAELVFKGLSQLRGTALKLAQMLSLEFGVLPESLRTKLSQAHYKAPPLNRALVRNVFKTEFSKTPEELFARFDPDAFAAASLGQVHRAVGLDGRDFAVKIQYPGIAESIDSDLQLLKGLLSTFYKNDYLERAVDEVHARLREEVDYRKEFERTQWFYEHAQTDQVSTPQPIAETSSEKILTLDLLEGEHLEEWLLGHPGQEVRDRAAQNLFDWFMEHAFVRGVFHSDPNPGNILFQEQGNIAVIDFGCVKDVQPDILTALKALMKAHVEGEEDRKPELYERLGIQGVRSPEFAAFNRESLQPFTAWISRPFREQVFDFKKHPGYCDEASKLVRGIVDQAFMGGFTSETVFIDRNLYGLYRIFQRLGVTVRFETTYFESGIMEAREPGPTNACEAG